MIKKLIFIIFLTLIASSSFGENNSIDELKWIENVPIFKKIKIQSENVADFDSVHGKILIIPFNLNISEEYNMKKFYNIFLLENGWKKSRLNKNNLIWEKKESTKRNKILIFKKSTLDNWILTIVVENF